MDGKEILEQLYDLINEGTSSTFVSRKLAFAYINRAATEFVSRTNCLRQSQAITTIAETSTYTLNANFLKLYLLDDFNRKYIKYNDGTNTSFFYESDYSDIYRQTKVTSASNPTRFSIIDDPNLDSRLTGTTTSDGSATNGESVLTDSGADFSDVSVGDCVHNLTDGSDGYIIIAGSTTLTTALFNGTANDWTSGDSYVIQPQARLLLVVDPPSSIAGHTITVPYLQRPNPVYSNFGAFRFQPQQMDAIISYAAWLFKYKDSDPNMGDEWYKMWEIEVKRNASNLNQSFNKTGFRLNLKARR